MKKIVVLSGAGMSAESGISTFRDSNGLWRNYRMEEVASPNAWGENMDLVLEFYNLRRKQLFEVEPNNGHQALVKLEKHFDVEIITQNVDDLHERAGSSSVLHLHGELKKARSTVDESLVYALDHWELKKGDLCQKGSQLRPHIVWFGEAVPGISQAAEIVRKADIMLVIGTSLAVYPAAGLINFAKTNALIYYIDPNAQGYSFKKNISCIAKKAGEGLPTLINNLIKCEVDQIIT
ncbi:MULTISPECIES: NAD-dependent deacylase [unclassified Lentimicrobium]|uniref:SIR2 family NAD-dependent protein deacylase n=1 Tax=unclassified Lentimicrobium TaxID=2677434 RepID=UPI0015575EBC|nr:MULTISPECIES: NAD-dependent deacylase [unclassified Lentimicrobium]NPD46096.1 NAD-dependent deacylase [Lentimicrobium sp. S6]NPD86289.1 NAD-dependent deacylase [Lentimicrobium sp. L6]